MKFGKTATKKDKVKVDQLQLLEHIRTNGLRCCYKREKEIIFLPQTFFLSLARSVFYKEGNYVVKWNNAYLHADASFLRLTQMEKPSH
jgi:hypothetical protein